MQTQNRAPTGAPALQSHPTLPPSIPRKDIQALIPRLSTAINDIDAFLAQLAGGFHDGSLPNWDSLLSRYALLLARLSALSSSISQTPLPPTLRPGAPKPSSASVPTLSKYLVHPLHPLPPPGSASAGAEAINPLAYEKVLQVLNSQLLPPVSQSAEELLSTGDSGIGPVQPWKSAEELRKMSPRDLDALLLRLRGRLERESGVTERMREAVKGYEDQVEWGMRIEDEAAEEEADDLFDDDEAEKPAPKVAPPVLPNPREGWTLPDYMKFMETGQSPAGLPTPQPQPPIAKTEVIDLT